jgi:hypothetical protein
MNKLFLIAAAFFLFPCCKKSNNGSSSSNGSSYYMKFKLNGTAVEYDSQPIGAISFSQSDNLYTVVLAAYKNVNAGLANAVTITLFSNSSIGAGSSYNNPTTAKRANGDILPVNTIFYYDSTANAWLTGGELTLYGPVPGVTANAQLTITDLTATYFKGTFSGTIYKSDLSKSQSITEGEFYLKRNN